MKLDYKNEKRVILLGVLNERNEEEEKELEVLFQSKLDWAWMTGQLIRHRLNGNFWNEVSSSLKDYIIPKVSEAFALLSLCYREINIKNLELLSQILPKMKAEGISVAGLKGVVFNTTINNIGSRKSNDIDLLIAEEDLEKLDLFMRREGFISSLDGGKSEATRRQKLIQRMNYHDLVPYYKKCNSFYMNVYKIDINFQFDSKDNEITRDIINYGLQEYTGNGFCVTGLNWKTHLLHLCAHYYRESTDTIWITRRSDVELYKLVDIENTMRSYKESELLIWIDVARKFRMQKQCYHTLLYLEFLYPSERNRNMLKRLEIQDSTLTYYKEDVERKRKEFLEKTFDMNYHQKF